MDIQLIRKFETRTVTIYFSKDGKGFSLDFDEKELDTLFKKVMEQVKINTLTRRR